MTDKMNQAPIEGDASSSAERRFDKIAAFMNPTAKVGKTYVLLAFLALIAAAVCTGIVVYYIAGPMEGYLHSDYTDTILWADASLAGGEVFNPDFRYAALLPFSANLWFMPLIAIFGYTMKTQVIGMVIFLLVFIASVYFMCRSFKMSIPWTAFSVISLLAVLSSSDKLREIMWGHVIYYSLALVLLFFGLGIAARLSQMKLEMKVKTVLSLVFTSLYFILVATNGFQLIAMVTLPVCAALFADVFFDRSRRLLEKRNLGVYITVFFLLLASFLGSKLLAFWLDGITASYADTYSRLTAISTWTDHLLKFPQQWFTLIGADITGNTELLKIETILMLVKFLVGCIILIAPFVLLCHYRAIDDRGTRLILWAHLAVSAVTMFGFICGNLASANWRLTSMMGTATLATVAAFRFFLTREKNDGEHTVGKRLSAALSLCLALIALVNFGAIRKMPADYGRDNLLHKLTAKLEEEGLEYGYASFWYSQSITLLSDNKVKARMILANEEKGVYSDFYQNCYSWYEDQEGVDRYFVLLNATEYHSSIKNETWKAFLDEKKPQSFVYENFMFYIFDCNIGISQSSPIAGD